MGTIIKNFIRFFIIVAVQVLILNKISLRWWSQPYGFPIFIPYIYPLFILLLPFEVPVAGLLVIGFITGLSIDAFMNTPGIHAFATVLLAYLRTNVLNALLPKHLSDYKAQAPSVKNMNWTPFLTYAAFLILIHHTAYFVIELWSMQNVGYLILKIIASTITTLLLIISYVMLFTKQQSR